MTRCVPSPKILATVGAAAVASLAYAVGSQSGDGVAGAATTPAQYSTVATTGATGATGPRGRSGHHRGGDHRGGDHRGGRHDGARFGAALTEAAKALGVSEAKLRTALRDLRPAAGTKGPRRGKLAAAIAESTAVDVAKVTAALDAARPERGERFTALARELGLSAAKVEAAFRAVKPERRAKGGSRAAFLTALAGELGVTEAKLEQALGTAGPGRHGGRGHGPRRGLDAAAVARALGTTEAKVAAGLKAFHATREQPHEELRASLVEQLASKLGVSEAEVTEVAERFLPRGGRGGPGPRAASRPAHP